MKSVYKAIGVLALGLLTAVGSASRAEALAISIDPATQDANIGDVVSVNIVASGITDAIGGFFLQIEFNEAILTGDNYTLDPDSKMGPFPSDFSGGFTGGAGSPLDLFFVADAAFDEADLAAAQGASFILATIRFVAAANGLSPVRIAQFDISNWDGNDTLPAQASHGEVCVGGQANCAVPEPGVFAMVGLALAGLAVARRRVAVRNA